MLVWDLIVGVGALVLFVLTSSIGGIFFNQFGTDLTLVAIGGETTVDYSLRLKREMASLPSALWVAGYSNDVFGYLGSRRVIVEGGYEGYSANMWDFPGPWATHSEERVIGKVYELIRSINH